MGARIGDVDIEYLIGEVAKRHGVILRPSDAVFAAVTLNELVLKSTVREAMKGMAATLDRFDTSIQRAENRAGQILGRQVKESSQQLSEAIHVEVSAANSRTEALFRSVRTADTQLRRWIGIAFLLSMILCVCSFWLGRLTALP
jgi:hypothetical protein